MARQFLRAYELTIIPPDGATRTIRDLRVSFEITKSLLSFPNLAKITLYNPSPDTLSALQTKFTKLILNAGYEGDLRLLFTGEIRNVLQGKASYESQAIVYAGDGERDWQNASFNKTYSANTSVATVVRDVLKSFTNTAVGILQGLPEVADKLMGQTQSGASKDILDKFADEYGFNWSIQDGEITIVPDDEPLSTTETILISSATGMVGSPTVTVIGADVTTLLNPRLVPNVPFQIQSVGADLQFGDLFFFTPPRTRGEGLYKVQEALFKGDSREGDWTTTVKGRVLNG